MALSDRVAGSSLNADKSPSKILARYVAVAVAGITLLPLPGISVLTGSALVWLLMFPVMIFVLRRARVFRIVALLAGFILVGAPLGNFLAGGSAGTVPSWDWLIRPIGLLLSVVALEWSAQYVGLRNAVLLAIPAPMIFDWISRSSQGNDWKYALSVWVTVGAIIAVYRKSYAWKLPVLVFLVLVSALNGTRGIIAMLAIAVAVDLLARGGRTRSHRTALAIIGSVTAATAAFQLAITGVFGASIKQTMLAQTEFGPLSILRSARPESGGNLSLVFQDPLRFVISESVSAEQAATIRDSFAQVSRDPNSNYVVQNVLRGAELHSLAADLWFHLGIVGLLIAIAAAWLFVSTAIRGIWMPTNLTLLGTFISLRVIWDLMFSPASDLRFWPLYLLLAFYVFSERKITNEGPR